MACWSSRPAAAAFPLSSAGTARCVRGRQSSTRTPRPACSRRSSTDVDKVALNYGTPDEQPIDRLTVAECRQLLAENRFAAGSMRPKIESAVRFLEQGGKKVIITQPQNLRADLDAIFGTHIVP